MVFDPDDMICMAPRYKRDFLCIDSGERPVYTHDGIGYGDGFSGDMKGNGYCMNIYLLDGLYPDVLQSVEYTCGDGE